MADEYLGDFPAMKRFIKDEIKETEYYENEVLMECTICDLEPIRIEKDNWVTYTCCLNEDEYEYYILEDDAISAWNRAVSQDIDNRLDSASEGSASFYQDFRGKKGY